MRTIDDALVRITPLTRVPYNYQVWIIDIRALLRRHGLWDCLDIDTEVDSDEWRRKVIEAGDMMTPFVGDALKQEMNGKNFENGYVLLKALDELLVGSSSDEEADPSAEDMETAEGNET